MEVSLKDSAQIETKGHDKSDKKKSQKAQNTYCKT